MRGRPAPAIRSREEIETAVRSKGLEPRGALRPEAGQGLEAQVGWLLLLGAIGGSVWPHFVASVEAGDGRAHPLDRWSRRIVTELAEALGAAPLFPFGGPPYHPFLTWARQAEGLSPSPLGMLIHPDHGLWHAYRGALAFAAPPADWRPAEAAPSPCRDCSRPCLTACPVEAFKPEGYDVAACRRHLASQEGEACRSGGCLARRACPVAPDLAYDPAQTDFHMRAFLRSDAPG